METESFKEETLLFPSGGRSNCRISSIIATIRARQAAADKALP